MDLRKYSNNFNCFLAGALVGAAAALMMAPQAGRKSRPMLRETVDGGVESVIAAGHELREQGKRLTRGAAGLVDRATHAMSG